MPTTTTPTSSTSTSAAASRPTSGTTSVRDAADAALAEELSAPVEQPIAESALPTDLQAGIAAPVAKALDAEDSSIQFARAFGLVGVLAAALVSVVRWLLPYLANRPSDGATEAIARRVSHIQSVARGLRWLEYPLLLLGTVVESMALLRGIENQPLHLTMLMVYAALWVFQILFWLKRPVLGRVVTPRQQPIELAVVRATNAATQRVVATAATDPSGRFDFHVHTGTYTITAEKEGCQPSSVTEPVRAGETARLMLALSPLTANRVNQAASPIESDIPVPAASQPAGIQSDSPPPTNESTRKP